MTNSELTTSVPIEPTLLRGFVQLEHTEFGLLPHRLPARARAQCSDSTLAMVEAEPSGVRLVFDTAATAIELDVMTLRRQIVGVPPRPVGIYDLCVDGHLYCQQSVRDAAPSCALIWLLEPRFGNRRVLRPYGSTICQAQKSVSKSGCPITKSPSSGRLEQMLLSSRQQARKSPSGFTTAARSAMDRTLLRPPGYGRRSPRPPQASI